MIYPQKLSAKETNKILKIEILFSILIAIIFYLLNRIYTPNLHWAALCNGGIIYIWCTVLISIKRNNNIANYILIQLIALSILNFYIDYKLGFQGWSINLSIPILIIIANITMLIVSITSRKKYIKYAICQLLIVIFSMLPLFFIYEGMTSNKTLSFIASIISIINLIISIIFSSNDIKEAMVRKFNL